MCGLEGIFKPTQSFRDVEGMAMYIFENRFFLTCAAIVLIMFFASAVVSRYVGLQESVEVQLYTKCVEWSPPSDRDKCSDWIDRRMKVQNEQTQQGYKPAPPAGVRPTDSAATAP